VKGRPRLEWVKPAGRRNEALDCAVYALAAAHFAGIDRWREGDWNRWQGRVEARDLFDAAAPLPPAAPAALEVQGEAESSTPAPAAPAQPKPAATRRPAHRPTLPAGGRRW
jgi:phage terminase large subunit GpA-like protein